MSWYVKPQDCKRVGFLLFPHAAKYILKTTAMFPCCPFWPCQRPPWVLQTDTRGASVELHDSSSPAENILNIFVEKLQTSHNFLKMSVIKGALKSTMFISLEAYSWIHFSCSGKVAQVWGTFFFLPTNFIKYQANLCSFIMFHVCVMKFEH